VAFTAKKVSSSDSFRDFEGSKFWCNVVSFESPGEEKLTAVFFFFPMRGRSPISAIEEIDGCGETILLQRFVLVSH
jgi:hypothetical protein